MSPELEYHTAIENLRDGAWKILCKTAEEIDLEPHAVHVLLVLAAGNQCDGRCRHIRMLRMHGYLCSVAAYDPQHNRYVAILTARGRAVADNLTKASDCYMRAAAHFRLQ